MVDVPGQESNLPSRSTTELNTGMFGERGTPYQGCTTPFLLWVQSATPTLGDNLKTVQQVYRFTDIS
jgi:hypothetical protein